MHIRRTGTKCLSPSNGVAWRRPPSLVLTGEEQHKDGASISGFVIHNKNILRHIMLNMNERMNVSLFNFNYKIINILRFTRSAILPHNLPKLYSTDRFSWSTICYCAGGRGLKVLNGTSQSNTPIERYFFA